MSEGTSLGGYAILGRAERVGLRYRYRALARVQGREVTLEVIHRALSADATFRERFFRDGRAIVGLDHPNIPRYVDVGEADGRLFLAFEALEATTLAAWQESLRGEARRPRRSQALRIIRDLASALTYAHERGVIHGDVKPSNVLLAPDGRAVLTGFGVVGSITRTGGVGAGSPEYMSPELAEGTEPGAPADVYALGVVAYELLTGRPPHRGDTPLAVLLAHAHEPLPLPAGGEARVGEATERVLLRALARHAEDRYRSPDELASALERAIDLDSQRGVTAVVPLPAELRGAVRPRPMVPARFARLGAVAAGLVLAAAAGVLATNALLSGSPRAGQDVIPPTLPPAAVHAASPTPTPTPSPATPAPTARPPEPTVAPTPGRGALLYEARLDGSAELDQVRVFSGGAADAGVTFERGAIELGVRRPPGGAIAFFRMAVRSSYVGVFTVSVPRTSEVLFTWALRRDGDASYLLRLDAKAETLSLIYDDGVRWREALAPQVRIRDLRSGRAVPVAFSVVGQDLAVYVDGRLVMEARDARIQSGTLPPDIFVGEEGGVGSIRLVAARVYALP